MQADTHVQSSLHPLTVLVAGFGDTGLLASVQLGQMEPPQGYRWSIIGVTPKPCHQSSQEIGGRLTQPSLWEELYLRPYSDYRGIDGVELIHGVVEEIDLERKTGTIAQVSSRNFSPVEVFEKEENRTTISTRNRSLNSRTRIIRYDVLLLAPGVKTSFWRTPNVVTSRQCILSTVQDEHKLVSHAASLAIVGAGPSGVSAAYALKSRFQQKEVILFASRDVILPNYCESVQKTVKRRLKQCGVQIKFQHRAEVIPTDQSLKGGVLHFKTSPSSSSSYEADLIIWATGSQGPNTEFIPRELLNEAGFIVVDKYLRHPKYAGVFAVGDAAASDPGRTSARNDGWKLVAKNIKAFAHWKYGGRRTPSGSGRDDQVAEKEALILTASSSHGSSVGMSPYKAPGHRWGSILGPWDGEGLEVFFPRSFLIPNFNRFWIPQWLWIPMWSMVQSFLWGGMRNTVDWSRHTVPEFRQSEMKRFRDRWKKVFWILYYIYISFGAILGLATVCFVVISLRNKTNGAL